MIYFVVYFGILIYRCINRSHLPFAEPNLEPRVRLELSTYAGNLDSTENKLESHSNLRIVLIGRFNMWFRLRIKSIVIEQLAMNLSLCLCSRFKQSLVGKVSLFCIAQKDSAEALSQHCPR